MGTWSPEETGVTHICGLLAQSQQPGSDQSQIIDALKQCSQVSDFNNYLAFILAQGTGTDALVEVRQAAGLLLKNNLKTQYQGTPADLQSYIKMLHTGVVVSPGNISIVALQLPGHISLNAEKCAPQPCHPPGPCMWLEPQAQISAALLHALREQSRQLRQTVGTCVAAVVGAAGLAAWPELVQRWAQSLDGGDALQLEGALDALHKVCEDCPAQLQAEVPGLAEKPVQVLMPRLLSLFKASSVGLRVQAVTIVNLLAEAVSQAIGAYLDQYLQGLFALAEEGSKDVRRVVCVGLVQMLHLQPSCLMPHMSSLITYMLQATQDGDPELALESCEFWSAFCEARLSPELLQPHLQTLIPVLLKNMVYEEDDEEVLDAEAAEQPGASNGCARNDDQHLKPFHHQQATRGEEDAQDAGGEGVRSWNLRRCSATGLDVLSTVFGDSLLALVVPVVQQRLQEPDWRARESAILALGAISIGCATGLVPFLPQLVNLLMPNLQDSRPLVRSITCWALSRYGHWIAEQALDPSQNMEQGLQQLEAVIQGLLVRVLDGNQHVQEAACSALAIVEECTHPSLLAAHLQAILQTLARAFGLYGRKNLRILYDALSTLCEVVGPTRELAQPRHVGAIVGPVLAKWASLGDTDRELLPLLACLTPLMTALGPGGKPIAGQLFGRSLRIVQQQLTAQAAQAAGQQVNPDPDMEFITCSLDLISGLAEGLGPQLEPLVAQSQLPQIMLQCCEDGSPDVRQSAFALAGDLAKCCLSQLASVYSRLVELCVHSLHPSLITPESMSASNNACWALGELAVKSQPEQLQPFAVQVVERLVLVLNNGSMMPNSFMENSAITVGRVAWVCPGSIASFLPAFVGPWCAALRSVRDDVEKEHALLGLCAMLHINPAGAVQSFAVVCEAFASWHAVRSKHLEGELHRVLQLFRSGLDNGSWEQALSKLSPAVRTQMERMASASA